MPITLAKLFSDEVTTPVTYKGHEIDVRWYPSRYTGAMRDLGYEILLTVEDDTGEIITLRDRVNALRAEADTIEDDDRDAAEAKRAEAAKVENAALKRIVNLDWRQRKMVRENLSKLLAGWDVLDDDGKPIPTDLETLRTLPDEFLGFVFGQLLSENEADPTKAPPSDGASETEKPSAASPTGTPSSKRRKR